MPQQSNVKAALQRAAELAARVAEEDARAPEDGETVASKKDQALDEAKERSRPAVLGVAFACLGGRHG